MVTLQFPKLCFHCCQSLCNSWIYQWIELEPNRISLDSRTSHVRVFPNRYVLETLTVVSPRCFSVKLHADERQPRISITNDSKEEKKTVCCTFVLLQWGKWRWRSWQWFTLYWGHRGYQRWWQRMMVGSKWQRMWISNKKIS